MLMEPVGAWGPLGPAGSTAGAAWSPAGLTDDATGWGLLELTGETWQSSPRHHFCQVTVCISPHLTPKLGLDFIQEL